MKTIRLKHIQALFTATLSAFALMGCDSLNIDNLESYDESMVWSDAKMATAYVNNLYSECFGNWNSGADANSEEITGVPWKLGTITETGTDYKKWDYTTIRHINEAIERISNSNISKDVADNLLGQAFFMRAYTYYYMVGYHGGVPYVTTPQNMVRNR